ncbi:uncharacterized protein LOC118609335 [Rousettus aegyptiacus]|uniref:uncharacterized protein LOC118609335 n=1 Tax=Rousettus aegyptiacus TaxID=9407 RepID=UPI00168CBE6D|nr:uncharacterized protein LOC118609335 [Rousettus aegyptiacus]
MQVRFPPLATAFLSPDRPITLLFVRLCLKTPVLYSDPSFSVGAKLQEPQWVPEAAEGTKPCTYCLFLHVPPCAKVHSSLPAHPDGRRHRPGALGPRPVRARTAGRQGGLEREAAGLGKLCRAAGATVRTSSTLEGSGKPLAGFVIPSECRKGHRRAERLGHMHVPSATISLELDQSGGRGGVRRGWVTVASHVEPTGCVGGLDVGWEEESETDLSFWCLTQRGVRCTELRQTREGKMEFNSSFGSVNCGVPGGLPGGGDFPGGRSTVPGQERGGRGRHSVRTLCHAGLQDRASWGLKQQAGDQTSRVSRESRAEGLSS